MPKLKYPVQEEDRHLRQKIVFSIMEVDSPSFKGLEKLISADFFKQFKGSLGSDVTTESVGQAAQKAAAEEIQNTGINEIDNNLKIRAALRDKGLLEDVQKQSIGTTALKLRATGNIIDLYLPPAHTVQDIMNYNISSPLNASGAAFLGGANIGSGGLQAFAEGIQRGTESIGQLFTEGSAGVAGRLAATRLAATRFGGIVPSGLRTSIGLTARVSINPNLVTTFDGVVIRQFIFNFKFLPKSPEESLEVKRIIKMFRVNQYPEDIFTGGLPIGFKYPNLFKIRLLSGRQGQFRNVGTPIKLSYLQSVNTTYNPGQQTFHPDGSPTEIDVNLTFFEYKTQSRNDILAEDNDAYYDYYSASEVSVSQQATETYEKYAAENN